jgi:hypothetical protein
LLVPGCGRFVRGCPFACLICGELGYWNRVGCR